MSTVFPREIKAITVGKWITNPIISDGLPVICSEQVKIKATARVKTESPGLLIYKIKYINTSTTKYKLIIILNTSNAKSLIFSTRGLLIIFDLTRET